MNRWCLPGLGVLGLLVLTACGEETATGVGDDLVPIQPRTFEVALPWSEFGEDFEVFGGFGRIFDLPAPVLAHEYQGVLDARILARFNSYPATVEVLDAEGDAEADSMYTFAGGRLIAVFDTVGRTEPVEFEVYRPPAGWDAVSTTWTAAVDTLGDRVPWEEEGAGPASLAATGLWDPIESDTAVIELDSAAVDQLSDTARLAPGVRLDVTTPGARLTMESMVLEVDAVPSLNQDTIVSFRSTVRQLAFIYTPRPDAPGADELRVGGAPAWRTTIRFALSRVLNGPPSLCDQVGCPFEVDPSRLSAATLELTSRSAAAGFQPWDSARIDTRAVLAPERLPKAPLGPSFIAGFGVPVAPDLFGASPGATVSVPVTGFVRGLVEEEPDEGDAPSPVLALLSAGEPLSLTFASFMAPGQPGEPVLRLVLTTSDTVQIR